MILTSSRQSASKETVRIFSSRQMMRSLAIAAVTLGTFAGTPAIANDLDIVLRAALSNSADLAAARQTWLATRENIGVSGATTDWRGTGTVTGTQARGKTATRRSYKESQSGSAEISFSRNLYDGGQTTEGKKAGLMSLEASGARYDESEQKVLLSTVEAYLGVVKASQEVELNKSNVKRLEAHVNAATVRLEAGASTPTRLAEANARLARGNSTLIIAETALANAEDQFQTLTALAPTNLTPLSVVVGLPATLLEAEQAALSLHPAVRAAKASERAAEQGYNTLLASVRPTVSFRLSASESQARGTLQDKTELSARIQLTTPLMVTSATKAKSRNVTAQIASAKYARDEALRAAGLRVRQAFRSLENAQSQISAVEAELRASWLVAEGIANEVEFGQKTDLDLQDAEQAVTDAELRMISAEHNVLLSSYRLQAAVGRLTAAEMGLGDVLGELDDMARPELRTSNILQIFDSQ